MEGIDSINCTRELSDEETEMVGGGFIPFAIGAVAGGITSAAGAYATGGNIWLAGLTGTISGAVGGIGGALYSFSRVAGVTTMGLGLGIGAAGAFIGSGGSAGGYNPGARSDASKE